MRSAQDAFLDRFIRAGRLEPPGDLETRVRDRLGRADRRRGRLTVLLRAALAAVAAAGVGLAAPALFLGRDGDVETHAAHELGSLQVALYLGLVVAAARPRRARGVLAVFAAATALLVVTAADDAIADRTTWLHEWPHALAIVGALLLWLLARRTPDVPVLIPTRPADVGEPIAAAVSRGAAEPANPARAAPSATPGRDRRAG